MWKPLNIDDFNVDAFFFLVFVRKSLSNLYIHFRAGQFMCLLQMEIFICLQ